MQAYKNLLAQLELVKAKQRTEELNDEAKALQIRKSTAQAELDALIEKFSDALGDTLSASTDSLQKARGIKSRGIALTHRDQGGTANGRSVSLLTKSVNGLRRVEIDKATRPLKTTQLEGDK